MAAPPDRLHVGDGLAVAREGRRPLDARLGGETFEEEMGSPRRLPAQPPSQEARQDEGRPRPEERQPPERDARGGDSRAGRSHGRIRRQALQREREVAGRLEPLLGRLLEAAPDDPLEARRDDPVRERQVRRLLPEDRRDDVGARIAGEGLLPREQLVEDGAEREEVAPGVDATSPELLGRHVPHRPQDGSRLGGARRRLDPRPRAAGRFPLHLREPEVEDLEAPVLRDEEVVRLQVPMDDPFLVGGREAVRDLDRPVDRLAGRHPRPRDRLAEGLALEQLGDDVRGAVVLPDVVDRRDVRVVEEPRRERLLLETSHPLGILGERGREHLDRHVPAEARIPRPVDLPHAAGPERREDLVGTEASARLQREIHRSPSL